ncbi:MAG: DUF1592 domain-containing protein [Myxococcales bacterium]|nr:DUF1592 domain-containing protein [Myxococcales bacterium]
MLEFGQMPPEDAEQPEDEERLAIGRWVRDELNRFECSGPPYVGRVTLRRLNRAEYDNTIRDLTGLDLNLSENFPSDDVGYGFDNIGDVLTTSPLHLEGWEGAGRLALENSLTAPIEPTVTTFEAEQLFSDVGAANGEVWVLWSNGELPTDVVLPADGEYVFRVGAFGAQAGPAVVRMALLLDGQELVTVDVPATRANPGTYEHRFSTTAGPHTLAVAFLNDYYMPDDPDPAQRDRNLLVDYLELEGPYGVPAADPARRAALMICEPAAADDTECARLVISDFARRAWRRPVELSEVNRLMGLVELALAEGDGVDQGILLALQAVLLSPHFLFKVEIDADPTSTTPHPLSPHELATRLSYFLWGSTPDAALLAAADAGRLSGEDLADQVTRMLADPRSIALVESFADQWLYTRAVADLDPDYDLFPDFDDRLRAGMATEARLFFRDALQHNRPLTALLDADHTFVDERLAAHYGLAIGDAPEVADAPGFHQVDLAGSDRVGLLTLGSVLSVTSYRTRTSPVRRGKWVLEQLMCSAPPPPPANVETDLGNVDQDLPLRERLAQHREDPMCAGCHDQMDPIGFGLEKFDAVGAFRLMEGPHDIDDSGQLPGGTPFAGAGELSQILREDRRFGRCYTTKLATFALGRGIEPADRCHVEAIQAASNGLGLADLVQALVQAPPFTHRRGEEERD